jgi:hypothetical protein
MNRKEFFKIGLTGIGSFALYSYAKGLEYYPKTSDKKWAVIYSTWCGSSRDAAVWISEGMAGIANVFDIRENPDLSTFDHLILGGSIRSGVTSEDMQNYIKNNKASLKTKVCGLFAVCGNMGQPVGPEQIAQFIDNHLATLCEVSDLPSQVFLGRITKSLMDAETAAIMAGTADYDNLKRSDCMLFGSEVLNNTTTSINSSEQALPQKYNLGQNYPQPFKQTTTIKYDLPESGNVLLAVYTVSGQKVATLVSEHQEAGHYQVRWDANKYGTGNYLFRLETGNCSESREAILIK